MYILTSVGWPIVISGRMLGTASWKVYLVPISHSPWIQAWFIWCSFFTSPFFSIFIVFWILYITSSGFAILCVVYCHISCAGLAFLALRAVVLEFSEFFCTALPSSTFRVVMVDCILVSVSLHVFYVYIISNCSWAGRFIYFILFHLSYPGTLLLIVSLSYLSPLSFSAVPITSCTFTGIGVCVAFSTRPILGIQSSIMQTHLRKLVAPD